MVNITKQPDAASLIAELEAAALNARNLLHVANRELLDNVEIGLSLVAAAEKYVADVLALNAKLCAANLDATRFLPAAPARQQTQS